MTAFRSVPFFLTVAAMIAGSSAVSYAGGGPKTKINFVAGFDGTYKVFNTDSSGAVVGAPIISIALAKGQTLMTTITGTNQDLSQEFVRATQTASLDTGIVIPNPMIPGQVMQANLAQASAAGINIFQPVSVPVIGSDTVQLFAAVDLVKYFNSGGVPSAPGSSVTFTNGTNSSLPGVQVGLSPITFSATAGYVNSSPFTGTATSSGTATLVAVPEPSSFVLLTLGITGLACCAVRFSRKT
jgi:hypothetical protein